MSSNKPRIRDLGIAIGILPPGKNNAITDVPGVEVGHLTLIKGDHDKSEPVIRTGVTVISPAPDFLEVLRYAGIWSLNGAGEMTGYHVIEEFGRLDGAIAITGTLNVGAVMEGLQRWYFREQNKGVKAAFPFHIPTIAETLDNRLTDNQAFPIKPEDILEIKFKNGPISEGNVGGGTGMRSFGFKGGIGTSSRLLPVGPDGKQYTLGVLVQANHGRPRNFTVKGVPVGQTLWDGGWWDEELAQTEKLAEEKQLQDGDGSLIVIVATDAPLLPYQLKRLAKRVGIGAGRQGALGENFSGDIFLAFSTAPMQSQPTQSTSDVNPLSTTTIPKSRDEKYPMHTPFVYETVQTVVDATINTLFSATADATEEAVLNALAAAETMTGVGGYVAREMPLQRVQEILREHKVLL